MRGYLSITAAELKNWLSNTSIELEDLYAPTKDFIAQNSDLDEEEIEFTLSMLAADDAQDSEEEYPLVAALEIPDNLIATSSEGVITLNAQAPWSLLECVFLVEENGEELTWFATQEIESHFDEWLKK